MKFALQMPIDTVAPPEEFQSGEAAREIGIALETSGVSAGFISEHPAPSAEWLHNDATGHDCLDPFTALAFVAASTRQLKFFSNIVVLPYRNPFVTAKAAATFQVLSKGRFILGVGIGYQKAEFDALGVPFSQRAGRTDEALETIRLAWKGGPVVKQGKYFNAIGNEPRPVPTPAPPIWVGGGSDKAVERAARLGDGWLPFFSVPTNDPAVKASAVVSMEHFSEKVARLKALREELGKSDPFDIAVGPPFRVQGATRADAERFLEQAHELADRGASWIWTRVPSPSRAAYLENVAWFGEEIISSFDSPSE